MGGLIFEKKLINSKKSLDKPHNVRYNISKLRGRPKERNLPMIKIKKTIILIALIIKLSFKKVNKNG